MEACDRYIIPTYLERSRSGKGGHVCIFFDTNYPANKSRKIVLNILELSGIISMFDKNSNYDRLFPNQDFHSGKGLGNLISLPLQKKALENNNSCFVNPVNLIPFEDYYSPDQFKLLPKIPPTNPSNKSHRQRLYLTTNYHEQSPYFKSIV